MTNEVKLTFQDKSMFFFCICCMSSRLLPDYFQHAGQVADAGSQTMLQFPIPRPAHALDFDLPMDSVHRSLIDCRRILHNHTSCFSR